MMDKKYHMPAEWEKHQKTWVLWPQIDDTNTKDISTIEDIYASIINTLVEYEPVAVGVNSKLLDSSKNKLSEKVEIVELDYLSAWIRDSGPTIIFDHKGRRCGIDWIFNGWSGACGPQSYKKDEHIALDILQHENIEPIELNVLLEGGAIHTDGEGTLLTTESSLLINNRKKEEIEPILKKYLGVEKIIWFPEGIHQCSVHGHVDALCAFSKPGEVLLTWTDDKDDPQYEISSNAEEILKNTTDAKGRKFNIHRIQQPDPIILTESDVEKMHEDSEKKYLTVGEKIWCSYINFYLGNNIVLIPGNGTEKDSEALKQFKLIFPQRESIIIPTKELWIEGGNIHCISQQIPNLLV